MGREPQRAIINGTEYEVIPLGGKKARGVFVRVMKTVGPFLTGNLNEALSSLNEDDFNYLCDTFAEYTNVRVNEKQMPRLSDVFDFHFTAKPLEMIQWLGFAMKVNFGDFYDALGKAVAGSEGAKAPALKSLFQPDATGSSGG